MIDSIFDNYLKQERTDFALLLTAKWGVGKTYYVKEYLKNQKNIAIKTAYISLYGLSSTKEIDSQIFAKLYPGKNSVKKYGGLLLKILSKNVDVTDFLKFDINKKTVDEEGKSIDGNLDGLDKIFELFKEKPDTNDSERILICLDDLERRNDSFSLKEICGYINYLTENGFKVLVISNNEQIDSQDFKALKEKTFGVEVEFNPDTQTIVKNIIESTFIEDKEYQNFLLEQLPIIMEVFFKNSQNLRIFKLVLHNFHFIREIINDSKDELKNISVNDYLTNVLRFICAITIECREGKMLFEHGEDIRVRFTWAEDLTDNFTTKKEVVKEQNIEFVQQIFFSSYFGKKDLGNYIFHESIFDFIFKGLLDKEKLLNELIQTDKDSLNPAQIAINQCYKGHHEEISDKDFAESLVCAKDFVIQMKYEKIDEYLTILEYLKMYADNYKIEYSDNEILMAIQKVLEVTKEEEMNHFLRFYRVRRDEKAINDDRVLNLVTQELKNRNQNDFSVILKEQKIDQFIIFFEKELFDPIFYDTTTAKNFFDFVKDMSFENLLIVCECLKTRYYRNHRNNPEIEYDAKIMLIELLKLHINQKELVSKPIRKKIFERILKIFQFELPAS